MFKFKCDHCERSYQRKQGLTRHILSLHPEKYEKTTKTYEYKCKNCRRQFSYKKNLDFHYRRAHDLNVPSSRMNNFKCAVCHSFYGTRKNINEHLTSVHQIILTCEMKTFTSYSEFLSWKTEVENKTKSQFVKNVSPATSKTSVRHYYMCSRSGFYIPRGFGKRYLKAKGSVKINAHCPAQMIVTVSNDGKCKVDFTKTHVGHECDLGYLRLSATERENIANKIQMKMPLEAILEEVRTSVSESSMERINILTKKDLYNISKSRTINLPSTRHQAAYSNSGDSRSFNCTVVSDEDHIINFKGSIVNERNTIVQDHHPSTIEEELTFNLEERKQCVKEHFIEFIDSVTNPEIIAFVEKECQRIKVTSDVILTEQ